MSKTIAIVTSRLFMLAKAINNMSLHPNSDFDYGRQTKPFYDIRIEYLPEDHGSQNNRDDQYLTVTVRVVGEKQALTLFKELVVQVRDQLPDQVWLDKMMDNILDSEKHILDATEEEIKALKLAAKQVNKKVKKTVKKSTKKKAKKK